jgi:choline dehydrogenase/5-(hydroxymethyl)furfural/furfural oxidase
MQYVVIGAGTAGCIVAARLSEDPLNCVILLEAGPDRTATNRPRGISSVNWIHALGETDAFWSDVTASRQPGDSVRQYLRGRGVGGSGAVNAMICLPGLPQDYDRWMERFGCEGWGWADVEPWFDALREAAQPTQKQYYTPVDEAMSRASGELGFGVDVDTFSPADGVGAVYLSADTTTRRSTAELWLDPARVAGRVEVRSDARADRLIWEGDRCVGVQLLNGETINADHVIVCAGTFESPALLLRSGVNNPAIGQNLRDHPAASLGLVLRPEFRETDTEHSCINVVLRTSSKYAHGDIHLLPLHGTLDEGRTDGVVMAALMTVRSSGTVTLNPNNPSGPPVIDMQMLTDPIDRIAMHEAINVMVDVLLTPSFSKILERVVVDDDGMELAALRKPDVADRWLRSAMGDYFHACGTCRMGRVSDPKAVVDLGGALHGKSGVHVIDASILPDVPAANTHWPTVMVAERLTAELMGRMLHEIQVPSLNA